MSLLLKMDLHKIIREHSMVHEFGDLSYVYATYTAHVFVVMHKVIISHWSQEQQTKNLSC